MSRIPSRILHNRPLSANDALILPHRRTRLLNLIRIIVNVQAFVHISRDSVSDQESGLYISDDPLALNLGTGSSRDLKSTESIIATFTAWASHIWHVRLSHVRPRVRLESRVSLCIRVVFVRTKHSLAHTVIRNAELMTTTIVNVSKRNSNGNL